MVELKITSEVTKFVSNDGNSISYQVRTREENSTYEMVNMASGESEVENIKEQHARHIESMFTGKPVETAATEQDDAEEQPKPKAKRGRKPKKKDDDFEYVRDVDFGGFMEDDDENYD